MTVYVDDARIPAQVGHLRARWSHLMAEPGADLAELHALAAAIGLRRSWFQGPPEHRHPHYDDTDTKRAAAIRAGAKPVTWREAGLMLAKARAGAVVPGDLEEQAGRWVESYECDPPAPVQETLL